MLINPIGAAIARRTKRSQDCSTEGKAAAKSNSRVQARLATEWGGQKVRRGGHISGTQTPQSIDSRFKVELHNIHHKVSAWNKPLLYGIDSSLKGGDYCISNSSSNDLIVCVLHRQRSSFTRQPFDKARPTGAIIFLLPFRKTGPRSIIEALGGRGSSEMRLKAIV